MARSSGLRLLVADLLHRPGARRTVQVAEPVDGLAVGPVAVPAGEPVTADLVLERVGEGIVVRGTVRAPWRAPCSRCLRPLGGEVAVHVDELFERRPVEGETYPLEHDVIDLEQALRDNLVVELPAAPLCRPDCAGLCPECGADRNEADCGHDRDEPDPRWAALRALDL